MKVIDNFLDKKDFEKVKLIFLSPSFPWYKSQVLKKEDGLKVKQKYNFQFTHYFYGNYKPLSTFFENLNNVLIKINPSSIIQIRSNLLSRTDKKIEHGFHCDLIDVKCTTGILYINSNNGGTKFKDGTFIESKENRFVSFSSDLPHTGTTNTCKQQYRIVLNLNYYEHVL
jgi:hypothetical protein